MSGRSFFDTTILLYSISSEEPRAAVAEKLLANGGWISVQVLKRVCRSRPPQTEYVLGTDQGGVVSHPRPV